MDNCAVFIDGAYFEKIQKTLLRKEKINFQRLAERLAEPDGLFRAYYYHCLPYQSSQPSAEEKERYKRRRQFYSHLERLNRFEVRLGRLAFRGYDADGSPIYEQKQVDMMIGLDMAFLAARRLVRRIAVVSGDADMIPAIERCKQEHVLISLWHGPFNTQHRPARRLYDLVDERFVLDEPLLREIKA